MIERHTIRAGEDAVTVAPGRGGIITSIKLGGTEIMYMDGATFEDTTQSVRGGVPVLFPNAGLADEEKYPGLKQHGFARTSDKWKARVAEDWFTESLETAASEVFAYASTITIEAVLPGDGSVVITQTARNRGTVDMPIAMGLHPYFKVPADRKADIRFNFPGGDIAKRDAHMWMHGNMIVLDNPGELAVEIPETGTLVLAASPEYTKIWLWSLHGQDFVCIEPMMRGQGGIVTDPYLVKPGESLSATFSIRLHSPGESA